MRCRAPLHDGPAKNVAFSLRARLSLTSRGAVYLRGGIGGKAEARPPRGAGGRRLTSWWKTWAPRRFLAGWGGRARQPKTPLQLARRGAAPAALDAAKNIPTEAGRTRPTFFPRKNVSGQGKDGQPRRAATSNRLVTETRRSDHGRNKNY